MFLSDREKNCQLPKWPVAVMAIVICYFSFAKMMTMGSLSETDQPRRRCPVVLNQTIAASPDANGLIDIPVTMSANEQAQLIIDLSLPTNLNARPEICARPQAVIGSFLITVIEFKAVKWDEPAFHIQMHCLGEMYSGRRPNS